MTKKDYILIAKLVSEGIDVANFADCEQSYKGALWRFAQQFATQAYLDNPRFDKNRFLKACGFED